MQSPQTLEYPPIQVFLTASAGVSNSLTDYSMVHYTMPRPLVCPDGYQWLIALRSFSCVNSQLVINQYNCDLYVDGVHFALSHGNYDANSLVAALKTLTGEMWSYSSTSLKVTFQSNTPKTLGGSLCSQILDIAEGTTANTISSLRTLRLTGAQSLLIGTDLAGTNITLLPGSNIATSLARVMVDTAPLSTLHWESSGGGNLLMDSAIYGFTVTLADEQGRSYLATVPYDLTLEFKPVWTNRIGLNVQRPLGLASFPPQ